MPSDISSVLDPFQDHLKFNLLKWQVGRAIICPACGNVLDVHDAVSGIGIGTDEQPRAFGLFCGECFEQYYPARLPDTLKGFARYEVFDGRLLDEHGWTLTDENLRVGEQLQVFQTRFGQDRALVERSGHPFVLTFEGWSEPVRGWVYCLDKGAWYAVEARTGAALTPRRTTRTGAIGHAWRHLASCGQEAYQKKASAILAQLGEIKTQTPFSYE